MDAEQIKDIVNKAVKPLGLRIEKIHIVIGSHGGKRGTIQLTNDISDDL